MIHIYRSYPWRASAGISRDYTTTFLLKASAGCQVVPHYYTAEEQLVVIRGSVITGMQGMRDVTLTAGGVAVMPGKAVYWFSCSPPTHP